MIQFTTLENIEISILANAFNEAFSDYAIPLQLNEEQMRDKLLAEDFSPQYSVGAFYHNKLVGFILHCFREENGIKTVYNGGTGVIPTQRGQHITLGMYDYILPKIKESGISEVLLEVLENNIPAKKSYEKVGFKKTRRLRSFIGDIKEILPNENLKIITMKNLDWNLLESFWTIQPSWQNASQSIRNLLDKLIVYGAFDANQLKGYVVYNPYSKRIQQIAVTESQRNQGIGAALFNHIRINHDSNLSIINVDEQDPYSIRFLQDIGLENRINLLEMKYKL